MKLNKSMILQLKTIKYDKLIIFVFFLLLHVAFLNVNRTEWGDSYRILRASEFIRNGAYPKDEKRAPLLASIIATRPPFIDAVAYGRALMLIFSVLSFLVFNSLVNQIVKNKKTQLLALGMFVVNPVYFYWSLRVMTDLPFSFFVLCVFLMLCKWKNEMDFGKTFLIGFTVGLAVLTRFEGYLLIPSTVLGLYFSNGFEGLKKLFSKIKLENLYNIGVFLISCFITILPFLIFRNPLSSSYLKEPREGDYNYIMLWNYFASLVGLFGFCSVFYLASKSRKHVGKFFLEELGISVFILLELILILLWPTAVPRLFVPVIPLLLIPVALSFEAFFSDKGKLKTYELVFILIPVIFYVVSQYFLKLQFLIVYKQFFAVVILLQLISVYFIWKKHVKISTVLMFLCMLIWLVAIVIEHRNLYPTIRDASDYASQNLKGTIVSNDATSIGDWYINYDHPRSDLKLSFYNGSGKYTDLKNLGVDYLISTNEGETFQYLKKENLAKMTLVKEFWYSVSKIRFFAKVYKVELKEVGP